MACFAYSEGLHQVTYRKVGFHNFKIQKSNYNPYQEGSNRNKDDKRNKVATEFVCKLLDRSLEFQIIIIMVIITSKSPFLMLNTEYIW